ncbi:single-stranded DNA-binding protein [Cellulomonas sp. JZ18]|uniref:single-stranded DNA-binding protein n=1 Tax=Cellulomonas sp. JZ18 TaxID=2654191 RepID=UPI0018AF731B|nr:single-stranded DNA-binding protein [Cellulomonas sp. JZ18]
MGAHTQDVTVVGWVGSDVRAYHLDGGGTPYAQFRLASTRRVYDRDTGTYRDGPTVWWTVKVWRQVADNVARSLRKGDPVVVVGRVGTSEWASPDGARTELVLEAVALGHDLVFGSTGFRRSTAGTRAAAGARPEEAAGTAAGDLATDGDAPAALTEDPWAQAPAQLPPDPGPQVDDEAGAAAGAARPQDRLALVGRG